MTTRAKTRRRWLDRSFSFLPFLNHGRAKRLDRRRPESRMGTVAEVLEDRTLLVVGAFAVPAPVAPGTGFDGIVELDITTSAGNLICTGNLLERGRHILTAAHCVTDSTGAVDATDVDVVFEMPSGDITFDTNMTAMQIHPFWTGATASVGDLAVLELEARAPFHAEEYGLYGEAPAPNELGMTHTVIGYGRTGVGATGATDPSGTKRMAQNQVSQVEPNGMQLTYDFDDGTPANNFFGDTTGLGAAEGGFARGDSGGSGMLVGKLVMGISSFGTDRDGTSGPFAFGDTGTVTRVSSFVPYIAGIRDAALPLIIDMDLQEEGNDGAADIVRLRRNGANLEVVVNGSVVHTDVFANVNSTVITGSDDEDTLIVDFGNGNVIPAGGLSFNGRAGADFLHLVGNPPQGVQTITHHFLGLLDGFVDLRGLFDTDRVSIRYTGVEPIVDNLNAVDRIFEFTGGAETIVLRDDGIAANGMSFIDSTFGESVTFANPTNSLTVRHTDGSGPDTINVEALDSTFDADVVVNGTTADDTITVEGVTGSTNTYTIVGVEGHDTLAFTGSGGAITVDFEARTITEAGRRPVTFNAIETVQLDAGGARVNVKGTATNDEFTVSPTGPNAATVEVAGLTTVLHVTNTSDLNINPDSAGGVDTLIVNGTAVPETINIDATSGAGGGFVEIVQAGVGSLLRVDFNESFPGTIDIDALRVFGLEDDDRFRVTPGGIPLHIDGGDPIGGGDSIEFLGSGPVIYRPGPGADEGSLTVGGNEPVSFDRIERIEIANAGPTVIVGTAGDDHIAIIARDASTHATADGVQDFTVTVNDGPEFLFIDTAALFVDALSGDDDVVLRTPAPNGVEWDVDVTIAGGPPAAATGDQGDVFELETPFTDTIVFTPTGADTATLLIDEAVNDSLITLAPFTIPALGYVSSPGGIEQVVYDGEAGDDTLTINGTAGDDTTIVSPSGIGSGSFRAGLSPTFDFTGAADVTVNGGTGGFDTVEIRGTPGPDVVTSTATVITLGGTVTLGTDLDRVTVNTFDGNDSIDLDLNVAGLEKVVDAGAGDDTVDLSDTLDAVIFGGIGDDAIVGSPLADFIDGGQGNDTITGLGGDDTIYGGEGNDSIVGGAGADEMFGGDGSDIFVWDPGDGSDLVEGGSNEADRLVFNGSAGAEVFNIFANVSDPSRAVLFRTVGAVTMDLAGIEEIDLNTLGGADTVQVGRSNVAGQLSDLTTTDVQVVDVDLGVAGAADGATDNVLFDGRALDDNLLVSVSNDVVTVAGLSYDLKVRNSSPLASDLDRLTVSGNEGDDTIKANAGVEDTILITLAGGDGDDFLSGDAILTGNAGNDFLEGGAGDDLLFGGDGEDTMIGGGGDDTFDGGADFDIILIRGTAGRDAIDVRQSSATTLDYTVTDQFGAVTTETDTLVTVAGVETVEGALIQAGDGDDVIRVSWADVLGVDALNNALRFALDGGADSTRDRLLVVDDDVDDLTLYRRGESDSEGSVTVGPANAEPLDLDFIDVEFVQFANEDGGPLNNPSDPDSPDARLVVFKHDPFEFNDDRFVATHIGANEAINIDPTIDPPALPNPFPGLPGSPGSDLPGDRDFYRIEALVSGTLDLQVFFEEVAALANGRPGLPGDGNLDILVRDADGQIIAGNGIFGTNDGAGELDVDGDAFAEDERVRMPVVQGQTYFLEIFGETGAAINNYNLTIINTPAPVPFDLEVDDVIHVGEVTAAASETEFSGDMGLSDLDDFYNGKFIEFQTGALVGQRVEVVDYDGTAREFTVTPGFSAAPAVGDEFQVESNDTGRSQFDNVLRDNTVRIFLRLDDAGLLNDLPGNDVPDTPPDEVIPIPFQDQDLLPGYRIAIFDEGNTPPQTGFPLNTPLGFATQVEPGVYLFETPVLSDGSHFLTARVQMIDPADPTQTGFGARSLSLEVVVDTQPPPVFFGTPGDLDDGLESDTGVVANPDTFIDRITNVQQPVFFGTAEANAVIRVFADLNGNAQVDNTDILLGMTVAVPEDGTNQFPNGRWRVESSVNLNDPDLFPVPDGLRTILVTAEDVAGNVNEAEGLGDVGQVLQIFIDTQGPQVFDPDGPGGAVQAVQVNTRNDADVLVPNPTFNLFDIKPTAGPTPRVDGLTINIRDLPPRVAEFLIRAIKEDVAGAAGNIILVGDTVGHVAISNTVVVNDPPVVGEPATATITIEFFEPLEDDRFTLTIQSSGVLDLAGNRLDGESNAREPNDAPDFPSGDGVPGGDFVARFTVDTRTEIGVWGQQGIIVDANGNFLADPAVRGGVHYDISRDLAFHIGVQSDTIFAGQFRPAGAAFANGYDRIGAYGKVGGAFRFLLDLNDNGRIDPGETFASAAVNGTPVAGNFDGNPNNGDEVGLFDGTNWFLDTNHSNAIELGVDLVVSGSLQGLPIVGDFDGDGFDDLATHIASINTFFFSLSSAGGSFVNGNSNATHTFAFNLPGVKERPFAGDFDGFSNDQGLGNEDFGIMVPNQQGGTGQAEFYIFRSGDARGLAAFENRLATPFTPTPLGFDIHTAYGHDLGAVVVGNFDPPSGLTSTPAFAQVGATSDTTPKVEWSPVGGTLYYEVHLYHVDRGQMVYVVGIPETGYTHPASLAPGRYESFVRARNSHGDPGSWTKMEFTVEAQALGVPVLTAPAAGSQVTGGPVTISWNAARGATGYQLLVYNTALGREVVNASVSATSHTVSLPGGAAYQVFVRASGAGQASGWSSPRVFEAAGGLSLPAKPDFLAPTLGGTTATLNWTAANGADAYQVVVYDMALGREIVNTTVASATSHTVATTPGKRYQIFVRGANTAGSSGWSGPQEFVAEAEGGEWSSGGVVSGEWIADYGLAIADYDQSAIRNLKSAMGPVTTHDSPLTSALDAVLAAWPEADWWSERLMSDEWRSGESEERETTHPSPLTSHSASWVERFGLAGGLFAFAAIGLGRRRKGRKQELDR